MDEQITLTQNQIFSASLKVSKSRSLVKRRMQSLGLKFTESQDVRNRLAGIEKGALKCVGQFCHDNDAESLSAMAIILPSFFCCKANCPPAMNTVTMKRVTGP